MHITVFCFAVPAGGYCDPDARHERTPRIHIPRVEWTRTDNRFVVRHTMIGPIDPALHDLASRVIAAFAKANQNSAEYNALVTGFAEKRAWGGRIKKAERSEYERRVRELDLSYAPMRQGAAGLWAEFENRARAAHSELAGKYRIVYDGTQIGWNDYPETCNGEEWYPPAPFIQRLKLPIPLRNRDGANAAKVAA